MKTQRNDANDGSSIAAVARILGWYIPDGQDAARNKCVVDGCGNDAVFYLCQAHAAPGAVVEVDRGTRRTLVISYWIVEANNSVRLFSIHDFSLGRDFGGKVGLEACFAARGYKVLGLISSDAEMVEAKRRFPGIRAAMSWEWMRDLLEPEGTMN